MSHLAVPWAKTRQGIQGVFLVPRFPLLTAEAGGTPNLTPI